MTLQLPQALASGDDDAAVSLLHKYFGADVCAADGFSGSLFDVWDSTRTAAENTNTFTADDLVAVTFLSVNVPACAARRLLIDHRDRFTELLTAVDPATHLVDVAGPLETAGPEWQLDNALRELPGIGPTTASKLYARKRPLLRPIYDSVVVAVTGTASAHWEPVRIALRENNNALNDRLRRLHAAAALPAAVSPLRVLDVICWMEGKARGL